MSPVGTEQILENRTLGPAPAGQGGAWAAQDPQGKGLEGSGPGSSVGRATVSTHLCFQPPLKAPGPSEVSEGESSAHGQHLSPGLRPEPSPGAVLESGAHGARSGHQVRSSGRGRGGRRGAHPVGGGEGPRQETAPPSTQESCAPCRGHPDFLFSFILRSATSRKFKILNII